MALTIILLFVIPIAVGGPLVWFSHANQKRNVVKMLLKVAVLTAAFAWGYNIYFSVEVPSKGRFFSEDTDMFFAIYSALIAWSIFVSAIWSIWTLLLWKKRGRDYADSGIIACFVLFGVALFLFWVFRKKLGQ
jgi:hypothetical protein